MTQAEIWFYVGVAILAGISLQFGGYGPALSLTLMALGVLLDTVGRKIANAIREEEEEDETEEKQD